MKATGILQFLFCVLLTASASYANSRSVVVTDLTTESKTDPIGIDVDVPRLSWKAQHTVRGAVQTAYQIRAALSPADLNRGRDLLWDTDKRESEQSSFIPYEGPTPLSRQRIYWKVRVWYDKDISKWSEPAYFEMGLLNDNDWKAKWIQAGFELGDEPDPCPFFRKPFSTKKAIAKARIYASAKGLYELHLNGMRVGDQYFTPGWTVYDKRIQYQTYDVTDQIIDGDNVLGMVLGNGWIRHFRANNQAEDTQTILAGIVQLEIEYEDGSTEVITTDDTWKSSTGPILSSTIYDGEIFDARLIMHGWDRIEFDDSNWKPVRIHDERLAILEAEQGVPVIKYESLTPDSIFTTPEGDLVVDMGQNMVGWIRLQVEGPAGTTVELRHTEVLDSEGNFYTENLRRADQMIQYTLSGDGVEVYEPHFTFQGFRYVKVIGFPGQLQPENITGIVLHSEMERTGEFECSNRLVNQLYHNIIWGQKGNFLDVPTDCPQRDERLGWTGDAQVFAPTACFNMNTIAFYRKWLRDMALDQSDEGIIPWIVPNVMDRVSAACGWADAGTVIPWVVYQYYGDKKVLSDNYEMMKNWVEYIRKTAGDSYLWNTGHHFGDWLAFATTRSDYPGATTDKDLLATAYYAYSTQLVAKAAHVLGNEKDAEEYEKLFGKIKEAFNREFITPSGRFSSNTQTAYVLGLAFGLVPEEQEAEVAARLAADVEKFGHITTGFLGTPLICHMLTKYGYNDLAYMLLNRTEYPSWLYPVTKGATTIWERWDGIKPDGTFQNAGMNSFNHYAYGAIGDWLFRTVTGINQMEPGFKKFSIRPEPGGNLIFARAKYESVYGTIRSEWRINDDATVMLVEVPANTTAVVHLPQATVDQVKESGLPLQEAEGVVIQGERDGALVVEVGSGMYNFSIAK